MSEFEEDIQRAAERGETTQTDRLDERAYREIFRALKKDPGYKLDAGFAERVAASVAGQRRTQNSGDYLWFSASILALLLAFTCALLYTGFRLDLTGLSIDMGFLSVMSDYKGLAIFGAIFITLLNWLDKSLIRRQTHNQ